MLDVHAPHNKVHTWKDFFIHLATISIGLLIAIGLEQTVEYFHHRHQVAEMMEKLRTETLENREILLTNLNETDRVTSVVDDNKVERPAATEPFARSYGGYHRVTFILAVATPFHAISFR